jgi:hypothetical protein
MISPGFPAEMPHFTRGLREVGASVLGVGDTPPAGLEPEVRRSLDDYLQVENLWDEEATTRAVVERVHGKAIDRVECLWEPGMVLAARMREALGVAGLSVAETIPFRDKVAMKEVLDRAGVRVPKFARAKSSQEVRAAVERIGYPVILKPIAGAGSADTHTVRNATDLESALALTRHVPEINVDEYIEGEEYTFDTVCSQGEILFENVAWYRPKPLVARLNDWISPQGICLRNIDAPEIRVGRELGLQVLRSDSAPVSRTWSGSARPRARRCSARSVRAHRARGWCT